MILKKVFAPSAKESISQQVNRWIGEHPNVQLLCVTLTYRENDGSALKQQQLARFLGELDELC
jgi:hypothetical protein